MIKCNQCGEYKDISEMTKNKNKPNGHTGKCKTCHNKNCREWQNRQPVHRNEIKRRHLKTWKGSIRTSHDAARQRCKKYGMEFNLDKNYLAGLMILQEFKCAITGVNLKPKGGREVTPSIDRIDPKQCYVYGNVQWLSWKMNVIKNDMNLDELVNLCNHIVEGSETIRKEYVSRDTEARSGQDYWSMI